MEWTSLSEIRKKASTYFKHSDLRSSQIRTKTMGYLFPPNVPPSNNQHSSTKPEADKPCHQWNYYGSCSCDKANIESFNAFHKCRVCAKDHPMLHCPKLRNPIPPLNSSWLTSQISSDSDLTNLSTSDTTNGLSPCSITATTLLSTVNQPFVTPVIQHIIASKNDFPNALGARIPVRTPLNIPAWESKLLVYPDRQIVDFLRYGWPINYTATYLPVSAVKNHTSAITYADHVQHYVDTELHYHAIAGPFRDNPFPQPLVFFPLQTVPTRGSSKRRVVMDLSFPPHASVNIGIPDSSYLNEPYKLHLPGIDRLCEFILQLGRGCLLYKLDLQRAYRQIPIDPKDYHLLGFRFNDLFYFDTRCPFGLKTSTMICQRTTKAVMHCFTQLGFLADVYLDDFYGAELPGRATTAFTSLKQLLQDLGLQTSPDKDSPPSIKMVCLGIDVDSDELSLSVPPFRVQELLQELSLWSQRPHYTLTVFTGKAFIRHRLRQTGAHFQIICVHSQSLVHLDQFLTTCAPIFLGGLISCPCSTVFLSSSHASGTFLIFTSPRTHHWRVVVQSV